MKVLALKVAVYVIELPLLVCLIAGFCLLVLLHFVVPTEAVECEDDPHEPKEPKDSLWQL